MTDKPLIQRLEGLSGQIQAIDTRLFEGAPAAEILTHAVPAIREGLEVALGLLRDARQLYPEAAPDAGAAAIESCGLFGLALDEVMRQDDTRERIVDVVVLGRIELAGKRAALAALGPGTDPWALIDACASVRRRVLKVLSALQQAIRSHHGLPSTCAWYRSELDISLAVRRLYTEFRRKVARIPEPLPIVVRRRLREAARLLASLVGKDAYEYVRISDRIQIRAVQERVLAWLRSHDAAPSLGLRIWQDFAALAGVLVQVNQRAELREHDLGIARELSRRLAEGGSSDPVGREALAALRRLYGRDDELDAMLDAAETTPRWPFRDVLGRIVETLDPGSASPDALDAAL